MSDDFRELESKVVSAAGKAEDLDSLLKATQALSTIRQIRGYRPVPVWPTVLAPITALLAVFMTAITLSNQSQTTEDSQWIELTKQISSKDTSTQVSLLSVQGFFDSSRHGSQARQIASVLLPQTADADSFEMALKGLVQHTNSDNQRDLVGLAKTIAYKERDLFKKIRSGDVLLGCPTDDLLNFMNSGDACFPVENGEESPTAKLAWLLSWEADSMSHALTKVWQKHSGVEPSGLDLSEVIFENETCHFENLNFSEAHFDSATVHLCDLSKAVFDRARLDGTVFHQIEKFEGSTWKGANWWNAAAISCSFERYLATNFPAHLSDKQKNDEALKNMETLGRYCTQD